MSKDLINIVHALIKKVDDLTAEVKTLRAANAVLLDENKGLKLKVAEQKRIIDTIENVSRHFNKAIKIPFDIVRC